MHQHLRRPGAPQRQRCGGVWAQTFSYDAFGNVSKSGSISWQPNYTHPSNQYQSGWNGASYDNNGDLLNDTFNTYTWDVDGDLASANGAGITYDAFGRMVENHSGTYQFVYAPNGGKQPLAEMQGQSLLGTFLPLPGGAIAAYNSSGLLQYMHADWLGSARLSSTPGRAPIPAMAYAPFGEGYAGGQAYAQFTGINAGTVYDAENESGSLEDFMFRRYSPVQGRWISPDPAGLGAVDPGNPQSWNRYAYVMNSPLSAVDPLGLADGDYESHKGCTPGATSIVCPFGGQTCNIDGAPAPCNMISGSSGAFALCPGGGCVFNEHGLFQYQQTSDDGGTWVRLNITSVDGVGSGAASNSINPAVTPTPQQTQNCLNDWNNSAVGKGAQFFSLYNLVTNAKNAWKDWTIYPGIKITFANLTKWGSQAIGNTEFLSVTGGTSTVVTAPTAAGVEATEAVGGELAPMAILAGTAVDMKMNATCRGFSVPVSMSVP